MAGNFYCDGVGKAPQRSLFHALGMTKEEMERPLVGIVSSYNEIVPGHMNIDKIVEAVKMGVAMAGGTPVVFPAIAVCDGIAMGHVGMKYSLVTRDLIAEERTGLADGSCSYQCSNRICQRWSDAGWSRQGQEDQSFQYV